MPLSAAKEICRKSLLGLLGVFHRTTSYGGDLGVEEFSRRGGREGVDTVSTFRYE
jgi:hypothetical protein